MRITSMILFFVAGLAWGGDALYLIHDKDVVVVEPNGAKIDRVRGHGTAFGVDLSDHGLASKGLLLTVAHNVVADPVGTAGKPKVKIGDEYHDARVLYMDEGLDVAILEVDVEVKIRRKLARKAAAKGDVVTFEGIGPVVRIGPSRGSDTHSRSGIVERRFWRGSAQTLVSLPDFDHGDSGGPLVNAGGEIVGIARAGISGPEGMRRNFGLFVPAEAIIQFVEEYKALREALKKNGK